MNFNFLFSCVGAVPTPAADGLRRRSASAGWLEYRIPIPPGALCLFLVIVVCCQLEVPVRG